MIVVTGASGFIGRAVVAALARRGAPTLAVCRRRPDELPMPSIIVHDYPELQPPSADAVLVHLAEPNDIALAERQGDAFVAERTSALARLLAEGWRHTVYASSAAVYGDAVGAPRKTREPTAGTSAYARAKLACERQVVARGGAVARLANVYGAGMPNQNVMSDILRQIPGSGPLTVRNRKPVRDYVWVEDAAEALVTLAISRADGVWNVGSGEGTAVHQLAHIALEIAGEGDRPVIASQPDESGSSLILDIDETIDALGWRPQTCLRQGISRLLRRAA